MKRSEHRETCDVGRDHLKIFEHNWFQTCKKTIHTSWDLKNMKKRLRLLETGQTWDLRRDIPYTYGQIWDRRRESLYVVRPTDAHISHRRSRRHAYYVTTTMMVMMIMLMQFSLQCHVFRFKFKSNVCIAKWNMTPHHLIHHSSESLLGLRCE